MNLLNQNTAIFIIRIWMEPREIESECPEWRGMIEHLETHEIRYFRSLDVLTSFIQQKINLDETKK